VVAHFSMSALAHFSMSIYSLYRDELDKWLESSRKNPVPLSDEELSESLSSSHRRKPVPRNW